MKLIETKNAVGHILCHDITQIIPGVKKGPVFRKGHIITEEDIPVLLHVGKENLYVWEKQEGMLHEDEAAEILREICENEYMTCSKPSEGKIEITAERDGLFKIDRKKLQTVNQMGEMMIATRHGDFPVKAGDKLAGMRVIPLVIEKEKMEAVRIACAGDALLKIMPYQIQKAAVITTGSEVFHKRIEDAFTPVLKRKLEEYGVEIVFHGVYDDNSEKITQSIQEAIFKYGAEFVLCTGGMSVDPDDRTPLAIKNTGADIVSYGVPVLPGAMFLLSYFDQVPVVGLPGCVMYAGRTIFDLVLPRLLARDSITAEELSLLGEGGLCLNCSKCSFPNCGFGKRT